jgi:site-specific DNA-methyltransferase (adenine-specific)
MFFFWSYLNGMPKNRDIALDIDKELNVESKIVGMCNYLQGYKKTVQIIIMLLM